MREILFRGKVHEKLLEDQWVYGYYAIKGKAPALKTMLSINPHSIWVTDFTISLTAESRRIQSVSTPDGRI